MLLRITIIKFIKEMEGKSKAAIKLLELTPEGIGKLDRNKVSQWIGLAGALEYGEE